MPVRVLRLLEYTFSDQRTADEHTANWGIAANGSKRITLHHGGHYHVDREIDGEMLIRSATLPQETLPEVPNPEVERLLGIISQAITHIENLPYPSSGHRKRAVEILQQAWPDAVPPEQKAWFENTGPTAPFVDPDLLDTAREGSDVPTRPYDNPAMQHPDDGHAHYFACVRCGVDNGINEPTFQSFSFRPAPSMAPPEALDDGRWQVLYTDDNRLVDGLRHRGQSDDLRWSVCGINVSTGYWTTARSFLPKCSKCESKQS